MARKLLPSLRERVWGSQRLAPWFPDSEVKIGEAWFGADDLPLLVKLIFTSERLSIQVHPDDGEGTPRGKTEMWHILEAKPGAVLGLGFREPITRERLVESARSGEIEELIRWIPVAAGETYFVPAHTVHAIGAGLVLCEIQQNSDVTYRLYDYGRPRELHLDVAAPLCDLGTHPGRSADSTVRSKHFVTEEVVLQAGEQRRCEDLSCHLWICLSGEGDVAGNRFGAGDVWQVEADDSILAETPARFLRSYVP